MKLFNIFKRKKKPEIININQAEEIKSVEKSKSKNDFQCYYCGKCFDIDPMLILVIDVPLLYTDRTIKGKGYRCPHCGKENIIG